MIELFLVIYIMNGIVVAFITADHIIDDVVRETNTKRKIILTILGAVSMFFIIWGWPAVLAIRSQDR